MMGLLLRHVRSARFLLIATLLGVGVNSFIVSTPIYGKALLTYENAQDQYLREMEAQFSARLESDLTDNRLIIPLFYETPEAMEAILGAQYHDLKITRLERQPGLIITADPERLAHVESFIAKLDVAAPMIRYKITLIEVSFSKFDDYESLFTQLADGFLINYDITQNKLTPMPTIYGRLTDMLRTGSAKLVASPTLLTLAHTSGQIHIGDKVPYVSAFRQNGTVYEKVEFLDTGLKLDITGFATDDQQVAATIDLELNSIREWRVFESGAFPILATRMMSSQVEIPIGQSLMIAGFIQEGQDHNESQVPFFSRIPLLGRLFDGEQSSVQKTDILVLISPEVIRPSSLRP